MRGFWGLTLVALTLVASPASGASKLPIETIKLPPGFSISLYAGNVPGACSLTLSPNGTLVVGTRQEGKVYALRDRNRASVADEVITLAHGLNMPNGVAFRDGSLYVAEVHRILRYDNIEARLTSPSPSVVVNDSYPQDTHHGRTRLARR